jgi:putative transposase
MPFVRIWIHLIFATKNREKMISDDFKPILLKHIRANAKQKEIWIDSINCTQDHIHILISLGSEQTISKIAMLIKGESSFWVNKNKILEWKFEWQDEYIALSVSESIVEKIRKYIACQEEHHRIKSHQEEHDAFIKKYGPKYLG